MNIYFDCEFTGLHKDTTLISIGLIDENNRIFYGVFDDYDTTQVNSWIEENVLKQLDYEIPYSIGITDITDVSGDKEKIKRELLEWLDFYTGGEKEIQFVSDCCHYDFVLIIDLLFGNALNMPGNISPVCIDLNDKISKSLDITVSEAFDSNREKLMEYYSDRHFKIRDFMLDLLHLNSKHNSLYDAMVIKVLYETISI